MLDAWISLLNSKITVLLCTTVAVTVYEELEISLSRVTSSSLRHANVDAFVLGSEVNTAIRHQFGAHYNDVTIIAMLECCLACTRCPPYARREEIDLSHMHCFSQESHVNTCETAWMVCLNLLFSCRWEHCVLWCWFYKRIHYFSGWKDTIPYV